MPKAPVTMRGRARQIRRSRCARWARALGYEVVLLDPRGKRVNARPGRRRGECAEAYRLRSIAAALRTARLDAGLTSTALAGRLGVHEREVTRWEVGWPPPHVTRLLAWAQRRGYRIELQPTTSGTQQASSRTADA